MRISDRPGFGRWEHFVPPHSPSSGCCIGRLRRSQQRPSRARVFLERSAPHGHADLMICVSKADSIAHQTSGSGIVAKFINGWNGVTSSQLNEFSWDALQITPKLE
jgi:hypothetical protein